MMATASLSEDTRLDELPLHVFDALKKALDQGNNWQYLLAAVEGSQTNAPPKHSNLIDPDLLKLAQLNGESPTEKLLNKLGRKGYKVYHLRKWLRAKGLVQAAAILGGGDVGPSESTVEVGAQLPKDVVCTDERSAPKRCNSITESGRPQMGKNTKKRSESETRASASTPKSYAGGRSTGEGRQRPMNMEQWSSAMCNGPTSSKDFPDLSLLPVTPTHPPELLWLPPPPTHSPSASPPQQPRSPQPLLADLTMETASVNSRWPKSSHTKLLPPEGAVDITHGHESTLEKLCYIPFDINTIDCAPQKGGVFNLLSPVQGVAENGADMIQVEVTTGDHPFTLRHAVLVDGPFQLPEGYRLASDAVYLYSDPSQPVRPFILQLPHWYSQGEGQREGGDGLTFVMAPHAHSLEGEKSCYKFELLEGGNFPMLSRGSLLIKSHSSVFAAAFKDTPSSDVQLKYCATHLEEKEESSPKHRVDIAVTYASPTWQKILEKYRPDLVARKVVPFNFKEPQIVAQLDETAKRSGKAALQGSAQVDEDKVDYHKYGIKGKKKLRDAVKAGIYPPTLSFVAVYDPALKQTGQPALVKVYVDGTTDGRLCFSSVVYEEKDRNLTTDGNSYPPQDWSEPLAQRATMKAPIPSMIHLQQYIPPLANKWVEIGTALGLEHQVLALQNDGQPPDRHLHSLLFEWTNAGDKDVNGMRVEVSWAFLAEVLRRDVVGKGHIASTIEANYIQYKNRR